MQHRTTFFCSIVTLAALVIVAGCRPHDAIEHPWASVAELDGSRNDVLNRVAADTHVPAQVLYALAFQQSRFESAEVISDDTMDAPVDVSDDPELADAPDTFEVLPDEAAPPEGLEDVATDIAADPTGNDYVLGEGQSATDPMMGPDGSGSDDPAADGAGEEHPPQDTVSMFLLTPDQVAWAAQTLSVEADAIGDDLETSARATAALLLADLALSSTQPAAASHARWEQAMARLVGLDPESDAGELAVRDFDDILVGGFDTITSDDEELMMVPADGVALPDLRTMDSTSDSTAAATSGGGVAVTEEALSSSYPSVQFISASSSNYSSGRSGYDVRFVVIHDIEGTMNGAISVFRNPGNGASAHYIVRSRDGHIVQMVPEHDTAWHSGNWLMNHTSIGIEHEGYAYRPHGGGYYTSTQYESSAQLTCAIVQRYGIPVDRRHIFGHANVAANGSLSLCSDAQGLSSGACGGADNHRDPGRYWDWNLYMNLVARCVAGHTHTTPHTTPHASPRARASHPQPALGTGWAGQRAVVDSLGGVHVFATDAAHRVVEYIQTSGRWSHYRVLGAGARGYPAAVVSGDRIVVAFEGADGHVVVLRGAAGTWTTTVLQGVTTDATPALFINDDGRAEVFVRDADGALQHNFERLAPGGDFGVWYSLGGHLRTMPTVVADAQHHTHVFAIGDADGHVWTRVRRVPGTWDSWSYLNVRGNTPVSPLVTSDGRLAVFTRTENGALVEQITDRHGEWSSAPRDLGGIFTSSVVAILDLHGRVNVFGRGTDAATYRILLSADGRTGAHARLGGRSLTTPAPVRTHDGVELFVVGTNRALFGASNTHGSAPRWVGWSIHGGRLANDGTNVLPTPPVTSSDPYDGIDRSGSAIPRAGLSNPTLRATLGMSTEPFGHVVDYGGHHWVAGRVSWFGGPTDMGVPADGRMAISGEIARHDNDPMNPSAATLDAHREAYYYCAMRFSYVPNGTGFWRDARLLLTNPRTGRQVVVRPADWGPNTSTGRVIDLSPQAIRDLGMTTDDTALVAFARPGTQLGVVH